MIFNISLHCSIARTHIVSANITKVFDIMDIVDRDFYLNA